MIGRKHLWAGDWESESGAAADELAVPHPRTQPPQRATPTVPTPAGGDLPTPSAAVPRSTISPKTGRVAALVVLAAATAALALTLVSQGGGGVGRAHPWLGVQLGPSPALAGGFQSGFGGFLFGAGATVTSVAAASPAAGAGIQPGDVITQVGNEPVSKPSDVGVALVGLRVGDRVVVRYEQGQFLYTAQVRLTAQPGARR